MHRCLPCSGKELVSSRLDGGYPPAAPRSNSVLGPIRHDMQEYYDLRQRLTRRELPQNNLVSGLTTGNRRPNPNKAASRSYTTSISNRNFQFEFRNKFHNFRDFITFSKNFLTI
jgi:hypothetical protein